MGISQARLSVNGLVLPANRMQQLEGLAPTLNGLSYPHYFMQAQKAFGNYIHNKSSCSVDYQLFNNGGNATGLKAAAEVVGSPSAMSGFVLAFNL